MISYETGFIILLVSVVISRIITAKALKSLSTEKKADMIDKFSSFSAYGMIPIVIIICVYLLLSRYTAIDPNTMMWVYFGILLLLITITQIYTFKKLKEMDLDSGYMRRYITAKVISTSGFAVFMLAVLPV